MQWKVLEIPGYFSDYNDTGNNSSFLTHNASSTKTSSRISSLFARGKGENGDSTDDSGHFRNLTTIFRVINFTEVNVRSSEVMATNYSSAELLTLYYEDYDPRTSSHPLINATAGGSSQARAEDFICGNYSGNNLTFPEGMKAGIVCLSSLMTGVASSPGTGEAEVHWETDVLSNSFNWLFLLLGIFVIAGGLGNVLVCLAICLERRLQNVTNYFLLSLAVADLLVCVAVMPFGIVDQFYGRWPFGWQVCNVWVTCDVLSCSSSIMHMCFISLGRYLGIRNPLKTRSSSKKVVMTKIVLVWLLAMVITSPIPVLAFIDTTNIQPTPDICAINNRFFFIFGSMFSFYIPMVIMVATYILTVQLLQRKAKFLADKPTKRVHFIRRSRRSSLHTGTDSFRSLRSMSRNGHVGNSSAPCAKCDFSARRHGYEQNLHSHHHGECDHPPLSAQSSSGTQTLKYTGSGMIRTLGRSQVMNEQKASKVLGIVFFTFVVLWAPFFVLNILFALMDPNTFPDYLATTFLWLGYASSTINPIIYTIFNRTFKRAFWKLITCRCQFSPHVRSRSANYTSAWAFKGMHQYSVKAVSGQHGYSDSVC